MMKRKHVQAAVLALVFVLVLGGMLARSAPLAAAPAELLRNGGFEEGFTFQPGCGMVGTSWGCFQNGGTAAYGFYDDQWDPVVYEGQHAQLIAIDTKKIGGDPDRYAGIYQTVDVVPGQAYHFSIRGMIRADDHDSDPWRYRVQVAFDHTGNTDWRAVHNWIELPWDTYYPRTAPGAFSEYDTDVVAQGAKLTVFIRVWKKWGDWYREVDVDVDAVSLTGPAAPTAPATPIPTPTPVPSTPTQPPTSSELVCTGPNLLHNGDFEQGFYSWGVGYYWGWFHNDGQATYSFYDDQWDKVVAEGEHAQLIEISTRNMAASDADRYAGIYQVVDGLQPGVQYELSLKGMMREEAPHPDEDTYRYRVQWGYLPGGGLDWTQVTNWVELPWDTIYTRTAPGDPLSYKTTFVAPSSRVTIFIRAWKKWPTVGRELDVDLDAITLRQCWSQGSQPTPTTSEIIHIVQPGEYLSLIAARYGTTVQAIVQANGLSNPNLIYVGQRLIIPQVLLVSYPTPPTPWPPVSDTEGNQESQQVAGQTYVVRPGDTLYAIAVRFNTTPYAIAKANGLHNLHWIYVGQKLTIPNG
ncbi:MAG: LysM peptidoglycan-binding domain-containing protein [Anaerolineae bacterium]|nr:LysM peptidoglycan-binding domain-containing protein [Anaerolineae bacterium]